MKPLGDDILVAMTSYPKGQITNNLHIRVHSKVFTSRVTQQIQQPILLSAIDQIQSNRGVNHNDH